MNSSAFFIDVTISGLLVLCRFPKRSLVHVSEHRLIVARITCFDCPLVLQTISVSQTNAHTLGNWTLAHGNAERPSIKKKKKDSRSTESQSCAPTLSLLPNPTLSMGRWRCCFQSAITTGLGGRSTRTNEGRSMLFRVPTEIDPNTTWRKDAMDDTKIIYYVFGLGSGAEWERVVLDRSGMSLTVSMKKQVSTASHCPACGSRSSVSSVPYISSKSPGAEFQQGMLRMEEGVYLPATREKSDPGGKSDGRTSGTVTGRSRAFLEGIFENEWMYGYMVCSPIDSVLGYGLGGVGDGKLGSVLVEDEVRGEEHVVGEFVSLTSETWWSGLVSYLESG